MISAARFLADQFAEVRLVDVFLVTGGGAMFLNDAFSHHPQITPIFNHHEQAAAMAAEAWARITGSIGVINVTTGPGGINALNGVFGAWTDSIPMLVISGQVKRATCLAVNQHCAGLAPTRRPGGRHPGHGAPAYQVRRSRARTAGHCLAS
jgi:acetolactate synthase-1/2/3 large subunit